MTLLHQGEVAMPQGICALSARNTSKQELRDDHTTNDKSLGSGKAVALEACCVDHAY